MTEACQHVRILGVDPGLNITGYAVLEPGERGPQVVEAGVVRGRSRESLTARLAEIHRGVADVIAALRPTAMALEQLYSHYERPRTAILMGHARGVICLAAAQAGMPVIHYSATQVKKILTGSGRAPKSQIQRAVQRELALPQLPEPPDVADALAIALCHYHLGRRRSPAARAGRNIVPARTLCPESALPVYIGAMPSFFDTHAHLDQEEFAADLPEVLARAKAAGVESILAVGVSAASSAATIELAGRYPGVYAAVGIHPNYAAQAAAGDWDRIVELARSPVVGSAHPTCSPAVGSAHPTCSRGAGSAHPTCVALGETGLDRHWDYTPFDVQRDYFDRHLRLSQQTGLPVVIHTRDCDEDVLAMLREAARRGPLRGIMHSFSGSAATAAECLALGLHVSFSGMVTYKKNEALREVARSVPPERLLVETDSPYLSPEPVRSIRRNEPAHVAHTAARLAAALGRDVDELARQTTVNARRLFGLAGSP